MPLRMARRECVPEWRPTMSPSVVRMPEVKPKLKPTLIECLITATLLIYKNSCSEKMALYAS
jgi:hypothetical protein